MQRDINKLRDLESGTNNLENYEIIRKKKIIQDILVNDPDIREVLGAKEPKPLNQYTDPSNPTEDELKKRQDILIYNENITHDQIVPWIKLNGIQKESLNFIMYDIYDDNVSYTNKVIKKQYLEVMILCHEQDMDTEYEVPRTDLLDWLVKDLLNWSNVLGNQMKLTEDNFRIIDSVYYCRILKFLMTTVNGAFGTGNNPYDRFKN
jgi:hypothetical protein